MSLVRYLSAVLRKNVQSIVRVNTIRKLSGAPSRILESGLPDVDIPKVSLSEFVFSKCEKYEHLTAIECAVTKRKYTYGEVIRKGKNFSRAIRKRLNLKNGDVVAVLLPNMPEFAIAVLGILHAGLIVTTFNPAYTQEEIARQLADSSAKAFVTVPHLFDAAKGSSNLIQKSLPIITIKTAQSQSLPRGAIDFQEFADQVIDYPDAPPRSSSEVAVLPYSSGTTGFPKGVQLTNNNLVGNVCLNASPDLGFIEKTTNNYQDIVPLVMPMFHIYGFMFSTMFILTEGAKIITLPKFRPEEYVNMLRDYKPHILAVVPPILLFLTNHSMVKSEDLQSVRLTFCGAAPLGASDEERFVEKAGKNIEILQLYGLTETTSTATAVTVKLKSEFNTSGSVGRPLTNTFVKIVKPDDPTGAPLGPNSDGELLIKGPHVMKGYLNKSEETKNTLVDGWLKTGDVGHYNEDGLLFITDRLKELIKVKGFQVAPAELEEVIRTFPNVEDAAVVGIPHPADGEVPRAYVVPAKGAKINVTDLEKYVRSKVAPYKQLKGGVALIDSIPKSASGKTLRRLLKSNYEKSHGK